MIGSTSPARRNVRDHGWKVAAALLSALTVAMVACSAPTPASRVPVHVAHELWAGYYPLDAVAADSATPDLLQVSLVEDSGELYSRFAGGAFDGVAASLVDLLLLRQSVPDLRIVGCTDESNGADAVRARPGLTSVQALIGRRIGVAVGTFAEMLVLEMLAREGRTRDDVELVDVPAAEVPALLRAGAIDAGETWEPYLSALPRDSFALVFSSSDTPGLIIQCLAFRDRVLLERGAQIRDVLAAMVSVGDRLVQQPALLRAQAARALARPADSLPEIRGIRWISLAENRRLLGADRLPPRLDSLAAPHLRFLAGAGALRGRVVVTQMLRPEFLSR